MSDIQPHEQPNVMHGGGWNSGPSTGGGSLVDTAIAALQSFGGVGLDEYRAASLLNLWVRRDELSSDERKGVIAFFRDLR